MEDGEYELVDRGGNVVARMEVRKAEGDRYDGRLVEDRLPSMMRERFRRHEELVNDGVFSLVDDAEAAIDELELSVRSLRTGVAVRVRDLQIMNVHDASFRI
jgi:hypothetical protein